MKPDHPSLALSSRARIHYGRAYEVDHNLPVQPLGLVHPASMETLLDQFEAKVPRLQPGEKESFERAYGQAEMDSVTPAVAAADMGLVQDMRKSITKVLGQNLSPAEHLPPEGTIDQFYPTVC